MEAYFDNSATTRVLEPVRDIVVKIMTEDYGNPSAKHKKGMEAEQYIKEAAEIIAGTLKVAPKEIVFTSGGSESNNMALIETAMANKRAGNHIISTGIEHASVYNPLAFLEEQGFTVTYLPVDAHGHIRLEELEAAIRPETILVSIMYVNNEIGAVEPIEAISKIIKKRRIRPSCFMWMPFRLTESLSSVQSARGLIFYPSAPIRYMVQKALDFYTLTRG